MKKKSGFTLIELLAVIIILSVIALISIPVILNVVEKVQKAAYKESLRSIFDATELYLATNEFIDFPTEGIDITDSGIEIKNKDFISGKIIKNEQGYFVLNKVTNGKYCGSGTLDNLVIIEGSCDDEVPIITVTPATLDIQLGDEYIDIGVSSTDNIDGDLTSSIVTTGIVDTTVLGSYILTYNVTDSSGNEAISVTRTVNVIPALATMTTNGNIINLSSSEGTISGEVIDDGGGTITERGIVYNTSPNPTITDSRVVVPGTIGTFSEEVTGLTNSTTYYARVYAINSTGASYGNEITFTTLIGGIDEYAKLMLHMDGIDNGTAFVDETGKLISRYGNVVTKTQIKKYGTSSAYFDKAEGDYLQIENSSDYNFLTSDFTIDFYGYFVNDFGARTTSYFFNKRDILFTQTGNEWSFQIDTDGLLSAALHSGTDAIAITSNFNLSWNTWYHIALVRSSGIVKLFVNGQENDSASCSYNLNGTFPIGIGKIFNDTGEVWKSTVYLDEIRISKGIARWTSNFTPPISPYTE